MPFHKKHIELVGTVTVGPKGQVVIPVEAREKMQIEPGAKMIALYLEDHKTIAFVPENEIQTMIEKMGSHITSLTELLQINSDENTDRFED